VSQSSRSGALDRLKGLAMMMVFAGHTGVGLPTLAHLYFFHRTVPVLIFAFGMSVAYWARRYDGASLGRLAADFYRSRYSRIFRPWWLMLVCWWPAAIWLSDGRLLKPPFILASFGGYLPFLLPSWFVTVIIFLIAAAPLMVWVTDRFGSAANLALAYTVTVTSFLYGATIMTWSRWLLRDSAVDTLYYLWIFPGCYICLVAAGMALARSRWVPSPAAASLLAALYAAGVLTVLEYVPSGFEQPAMLRILDAVLALALFGFCDAIAGWGAIASGLEWCGRRSWALYLVHIPTFDIFTRLGMEPAEHGFTIRLGYCVVLVIGTITAIRIGDRVRATVFDRSPG